MIKLSRKVEYGLMSLQFLVEQNQAILPGPEMSQKSQTTNKTDRADLTKLTDITNLTGLTESAQLSDITELTEATKKNDFDNEINHKNLTLNSKKRVTAKQISQFYNIPFDVTAKCLQIMGQHEVLRSVTGVQGGYEFGSRWSQVTLLDLMDMLDGEAHLARCIDSQHSCEYSKKCGLVDPLVALNKKMRQFLAEISIKDWLMAESTKVSHIDSKMNHIFLNNVDSENNITRNKGL